MTPIEENRLIQTLGDDERRFYVYALCKNDGTPFYIGKGTGRRILDHEDAAQLAKDAIESDETLTDAEKQQRLMEQTNKIKTILDEGADVKEVIVKWGLTENEAFMCESALINMLKFTKGKTVVELTNIVNGHASRKEKDSVADIKTKARDINGFMSECAVAVRDIAELKEKIALIKINEFYPRCINADGSVDLSKVTDSVRGIWPIQQNRRGQIKYIFALYRYRVVGIFQVTHAYDSVGDEYARRNGELEDFPTFPEDVRKFDIYKARFSSLAEARSELSAEDFRQFEEVLRNELLEKKQEINEGNMNRRIALGRRRAYFSVDSDLSSAPCEIRECMNCVVVKNRLAINTQAPVIYNF